MGLFDELENTPETPESDVIRRNTERPTLEAPEVSPETPEEVMMVARTVRKQAQEEDGMAFGNPVDLAEQFNNTIIGAIGGSADMVAWAGRKAMTTLGASEETAYKFFASGNTEFIKSGTMKLGIGSNRKADTFMGYTGNTFGEAAAFLAGGAGVVAKTKQASGVVGAISRQADVALKTKLGTVVAGEAAVSVGAAAGRQIAEENEFGATGAMATEFATGALALVSAAGAKKVILDPLTAKLKNMTQKEALEKLSKEEIAEVVAEGQKVIAKEQPAPERIIDKVTDRPLAHSLIIKKVKNEASEIQYTVPPKAKNPLDAVGSKGIMVDGEYEAATKALTEYAEELKPIQESFRATLRRELGDTITVYRGEAEGFTPAAGRELESWSLDESVAKRYANAKGGQVKSKEIPVEDVEWVGSQRETELIIRINSKSTPEDAIDASIAATKSILEGDRTGGKGARITAEVKPHFKAVAVEMSDQFNAFAGAKNADDAMVSAKAILARIDRFIDFDRIIAKKDYAQGSELVANAGHVTPDSFKAGITAEANQRTADLQTLKNMLEDFTGGAGAKNADEVAEAVAKGADEAAEGALESGTFKGAVTLEDAQAAAADMAKKLTPEEKLTAIRAHMESMTRSRSTGPLMSLFDGYFVTRTAMALNQVKTGLVGTYSAALKSWLTPLENTLNAIDGSLRVKDASVQRRLKYALSELLATQEYIGTFKNNWRNLGMNMRNTFLETGDSQLLYKEAQAYKGQEGISQQHTNFFQRRNLARAARTEAYNNASNPIDKSYKGLKKAILNNNVADTIPLLFKFGFGLIGSVEEVSLMTLSRRAQRAKAIQAGIREGAEDINQYVDDWMNDAFIEQGDGSMRINYDPKYADGFNEARYDHFRSLDIPASDIRVEGEQAFVAALNKVAETPNELGMITKFVMMFRGVPTRVGAQLIAYAPPVAQYRALKVGTRKLASAGESLIGEGEVSFGKYASKIGELKADVKRQTKLLDDPNTSAEVRKEAEAIIAQSDEQIARLETYQRADDYRDIARAAVSTGLFLLGVDHGRKGITTGSQSDLTREQKFDAQKVDGAPNDWKIRWNELELDFRYAEPFKGAYGMGASWGRRQLSDELGALTPDQTVEQFFIDSYMDMILDMPAMQGGKSVSQAFSANPETRAKAFTNLKRSAFPIPSELRNILKWDEEFVTDGTQGDSTQSAWRGAVGIEQDNYRLTLLGEPKRKEEQTLFGHLTPYGGRRTVERTEIDNILLEDAMSFGTVSEIPTSVSGMQLKKFVHVDDYNGETLYSKFGQLITTTKIGGKTQQKALEQLIKKDAFKKAIKRGYSQNEQGTDVNEGIEMMKDIMSEYRAEARKILLETKAATDYVDSDGNNIYNILKEREAFSERPDSLLESLNLK